MQAEAEAWQADSGTPLHQPWPAEAQTLAYQALTRLGRTWDNETDPLRSFLRPEALRLIDELDNDELDHSRRAKIGERLATIGDPRSRIGVHDGTPDIVWHDIAEDRQAMARLAVAPFRIARYPVTWRQFQAPSMRTTVTMIRVGGPTRCRPPFPPESLPSILQPPGQARVMVLRVRLQPLAVGPPCDRTTGRMGDPPAAGVGMTTGGQRRRCVLRLPMGHLVGKPRRASPRATSGASSASAIIRAAPGTSVPDTTPSTWPAKFWSGARTSTISQGTCRGAKVKSRNVRCAEAPGTLTETWPGVRHGLAIIHAAVTRAWAFVSAIARPLVRYPVRLPCCPRTR